MAKGYSLLWPEHGEVTRVDWKPGSVVVPPSQWFHQHFNSGADPARYLALRWNSWRYNFVALGDDKPIEVSVKDGGTQIEYEDEDPKIHEFFESLPPQSWRYLPHGLHGSLVHAKGSGVSHPWRL